MKVSDLMAVNLLVALPLEAKPFIELFRLQFDGRHGSFQLYRADNIRLLVCGMGKLNAAAGTAFLAALCAKQELKSSVWINAGIAGHRSHALATTLMASKVINKESGHTFYPMLFPVRLKSGVVCSVDQPETNYEQDCVYDMEAAAFVEVAAKFACLEYIQVVKVVSDNQITGIDNLSNEAISDYMKINAADVLMLIKAISDIANAINSARSLPRAFELMSVNLRMSVTQKEQLKRLCQRYNALGLQTEMESLARAKFSTAKQLIAHMVNALDNPDENVK